MFGIDRLGCGFDFLATAKIGNGGTAVVPVLSPASDVFEVARAICAAANVDLGIIGVLPAELDGAIFVDLPIEDDGAPVAVEVDGAKDVAPVAAELDGARFVDLPIEDDGAPVVVEVDGAIDVGPVIAVDEAVGKVMAPLAVEDVAPPTPVDETVGKVMAPGVCGLLGAVGLAEVGISEVALVFTDFVNNLLMADKGPGFLLSEMVGAVVVAVEVAVVVAVAVLVAVAGVPDGGKVVGVTIGVSVSCVGESFCPVVKVGSAFKTAGASLIDGRLGSLFVGVSPLTGTSVGVLPTGVSAAGCIAFSS